MRECTICAHTNRGEIDAALVGRVPDREVERRFAGLTRGSISRHRRNHLGVVDGDSESTTESVLLPAAAKLTTVAIASDQPVTEQIKSVCADLRQLIATARRKGNLGVANQGLKNLTNALETLARLTGELDQPTTTTIFNTVWFDGLVKKYSSSTSSTTIDVTPISGKEIE